MSEPESRFYIISKTGKLDKTDSLTEALAATSKDAYIWLDYTQPTREQLSALIEPLGLHPLSIEDSTDDEQIPKMEDFLTYTFMIFNAFEFVDATLRVHELDFFIGNNFLITVSNRDSKGQSIFKDFERFIELESTKIQQGPSFLLYLLLDKVVDNKFLILEALEEKLDLDEETILTDLVDFSPADLLNTRKDLLIIRKTLFYEREIIGKITRRDSPFFSEKVVMYYRDIYDHLSKYYELTESARDLVTSLMEMYLSMLNNQMAKAANQTNAIMRRLTLITTIFMPLTLLSGIGGMSEFTMITGAENWRIAYFALFGIMFVIAIINWFLLQRLEKKVSNEE